MLFVLLMTGAAAQVEPAQPIVRATATATVRIEHPAKAGREEWQKASESHRSEIIVQDKEGQPVLLRLVEYQ